MALAADIRTCLRFHHQLGVEYYPLTPQLQRCLAKKGEQPDTAACAQKVLQPCPPSHPKKSLPANSAVTAEQLVLLHRDIEDCRLCTLASARQGQVTGAGTIASRLLLIGDYSSQEVGFSATALFGAAEDAMLWNMMRAIGLGPEDVYVTNTVKCCPRAAQQPEQESEQRCLSYLRREIELVRPRIICAMGEVAARSILGGSEPVARLRGRFHRYQYGGEESDPVQVMVTFHPRFLLEHGDMKKAVWQDLQMIQRQLRTLL